MALAGRTPATGPGGKECTIAYVSRIAEPGDADVLAGWLRTDVAASWIAEQLMDEYGIRLSSETIRRHRRRACACESA